MNIDAYTTTPPYTTFLYPKSRQFPFDEVCEKIVRGLEKRSWQIHGMQIEFTNLGTGEEKFRYVSQIKGDDFNLWFCRCQGIINNKYNDIAAVKRLTIPKKQLDVYEDESGPSYHTYVGENWEKDKNAFTDNLKVNSKSKKQPRSYLAYSGSTDKSAIVEKTGRNPYLTNDTDFDNEYKAGEDDPKFYDTKTIFQEMNLWLTDNVLKKIEELPQTSGIGLTTEPNIKYPNYLGAFYLAINHETYERISIGKTNKNQLSPSERYALVGEGLRLLSSSVKFDNTYPVIAHECFESCSFDLPELDPNFVAILSITPKFAHHIYVVDNDPEDPHSLPPPKGNISYHEYLKNIARTLIPIHQYQGNYKSPVALILSGRELSFDEVEIVKTSIHIKGSFLSKIFSKLFSSFYNN